MKAVSSSYSSNSNFAYAIIQSATLSPRIRTTCEVLEITNVCVPPHLVNLGGTQI